MARDEPLWLRAAAVSAALAGLRGDKVFAGLTPEDAAAAERVLTVLRSAGDRAAVARAIARERVRVTLRPVAPTSTAIGARFLARWMGGLAPRDRPLVARGLDPVTAHAVTAAIRGPDVSGTVGGTGSIRPLVDQAVATWLVAHARDAATRLPTAVEWTAVLMTLAGEGEPTVLAGKVDRRVRACGRSLRCAALARDVGLA